MWDVRGLSKDGSDFSVPFRELSGEVFRHADDYVYSAARLLHWGEEDTKDIHGLVPTWLGTNETLGLRLLEGETSADRRLAKPIAVPNFDSVNGEPILDGPTGWLWLDESIVAIE